MTSSSSLKRTLTDWLPRSSRRSSHSQDASLDLLPGPNLSPKSPWRLVKASVRITSAFTAMLNEVKAQRVAAQKWPSNVLFEVSSPGQQKAVPLWQQGDATLHTVEALEARGKLRRDPAVVELLHRWWVAAQRSLQSGTDGQASSLKCEHYVTVHVKIAKAMLSDFEEEEVRDWLPPQP